MAEDAPNADEPDEVGPPGRVRMPGWVPKAVFVFWAGYVGTLVFRWGFSQLTGLLTLLLVSLFLSFAIEPGVNRLVTRGWRRGQATALILITALVVVSLFIGAMGTLIGGQVADLLQNTDQYITRIVRFMNDNFGTKFNPKSVNDDIQDPNGGFQRFIASQRDDALRLSAVVLRGLFDVFSALFFTFYLVADGPKLRRGICSRLRPSRQVTVLKTWELAIEKTGGYLYSRALLAGISAVFHWVAFTALGIPAPIALALWVGIMSQFVPVIGAYVAGALPVLIALANPGSTPLRALLALVFITIFQQIQDYVFAPRITARTMELHPAVAFGSALAGAALLGPVGAILALPATAMVQAVVSEMGGRHGVVSSPLTSIQPRRRKRRRRHRQESERE